jgi:hypothetical protein
VKFATTISDVPAVRVRVVARGIPGNGQDTKVALEQVEPVPMLTYADSGQLRTSPIES